MWVIGGILCIHVIVGWEKSPTNPQTQKNFTPSPIIGQKNVILSIFGCFWLKFRGLAGHPSWNIQVFKNAFIENFTA